MKPAHVNLDLSSPQVMAIINVTPDSFYDVSRVREPQQIEVRIACAVEQGATILDIGGYSSRPGADEVSVEEEWQRVAAGIEAARRVAPGTAVSVDTFRSEVVARSVERFGAVIVNDISAGEQDPQMHRMAAKYALPYIAMHMRGTPQTMQSMTDYKDLVGEVIDYFRWKSVQLKAAGVRQVVLDPGFGFSKMAEQNFELLRGMHRLCELGFPLLAGVSRKSMIWRTLGVTPAESLAGTVALGWECLRQGASILRVHDVREASDTIKLFNAYRYAKKKTLSNDKSYGHP